MQSLYLQKQSFCTLCMARDRSQKESWSCASKNFVQTFGLQAEGGKTTFCKPYKAKLCMAAKLLAIQSLQSEALYKLCKAFASHTKVCKTLAIQRFALVPLCLWIASLTKQSFVWRLHSIATLLQACAAFVCNVWKSG